MKNKTIFIGINQIEMAMDELRKKKEITKDSSIQIKKLLKRVGWLTNPPYTLSLMLMIFVVVIVPDKIFDTLIGFGSILSVVLTLVFAAALVSFSIFFPKLIFFYPRKKAIAKLGKGLQVHELLKSLFIKYFCPMPKEVVAYAKRGWVSPGRR